jgi:hypothetical protein
MTEVIVPIAIGVLALTGLEIFRWMRRPAARRLRMIRKIGGRR